MSRLTAHHKTNRRSAACCVKANNFGAMYIMIDDDAQAFASAGVDILGDGVLAVGLTAKKKKKATIIRNAGNAKGTNALASAK